MREIRYIFIILIFIREYFTAALEEQPLVIDQRKNQLPITDEEAACILMSLKLKEKSLSDRCKTENTIEKQDSSFELSSVYNENNDDSNQKSTKRNRKRKIDEPPENIKKLCVENEDKTLISEMNSFIDAFKALINEKTIEENTFFDFIDQNIFDEFEFKKQLVETYIPNSDGFASFPSNFSIQMNADLKKTFFNIFKTIKINGNIKIDENSNQIYKSKNKEQYLEIERKFSNIKNDLKIKGRSKNFNEIFTQMNQISTETFSELVSGILEKLIKINGKSFIRTSKELLSNEIVLGLIDDSIMKVEYDILFLSEFIQQMLFKNIQYSSFDKNFISLRSFVQAQKIFMTNFHNYLLNNNKNKNIIEPNEINRLFQELMPLFGHSSKKFILPCLKSYFFIKMKKINENDDLKIFSFLIMYRMGIINHVVSQIKCIAKNQYSGNSLNPKNHDDLSYLLLLTFLDSKKLKENYKGYFK